MLKDLTYLEVAVDEATGDTESGTTQESTETVDGSNTGEGNTPNTEETFFEIDGEKLTPQQIKEYRQGYLRQADYTKKTQEIASQRKQYESAVQLYEYLNSKPQLIEKLREFDTENSDVNNLYKHNDPVISELKTEVMAMKINQELELLKMKDPDFNEVEVLNYATKENMPIEKAYKMWKGENFDKILKDRLAKQSAKLTEDIKKGQQVTTLMNPNDKQANGTYGLSQVEMSMADKLGMTYEEYKKWK